MGLLEPSDGQLLVDGADIHDPFHPERLAAWRAAIAHVPQNVYLTDGSIAEKIAFGLTSDQIDMDKVVEAARYAHILILQLFLMGLIPMLESANPFKWRPEAENWNCACILQKSSNFDI